MDKEPIKKLDDLPDVMTAEVLAGFLGISRRRAYELMDIKVEAGGIPCFRLGRNKRVLKIKLAEWLGITDVKGA